MTEAAKLIVPTDLPYNGSQGSLAISDQTVAAGVALAKIGSNAEQGAVYIYERPAGGWRGNLLPSARLIASDGSADDRLGSTVAMSGRTVVGGAEGDTRPSQRGAGSVIRFRGARQRVARRHQ